MPSWREIRRLTPQQNRFLDALTCQPPYDKLFAPSKTEDGRDGPRTPCVLFGGSGFSGKTHGLLSAMVEIAGLLAEAGVPSPTGAIICKNYPELMDRIVRAIEKDPDLMMMGRVRNTKKEGYFFEFYNQAMGRVYLRNVGQDADRRRGIEYDFILIDELTQLSRSDYDAIKYMLRSSKPGIPFLPFGAASNPDGPGHGWVKRWWINRDFVADDELVKAGALRPDDFTFVPGRPTDNPAFNSAVKASLMGFEDPMLVKSRWEGSWDLAAGTRFSQFSREVHEFDDDEFQEFYGRTMGQAFRDRDMFTVFGSLDYGTDLTGASAFYLHAVDPKRRVWTFKEAYLQGMFLEAQADVLGPMCAEWGCERVYCDPSLWQRDSDGISRFNKFRERGVPMILANNARIEGWATLDGFLHHLPEAFGQPRKPPAWRIHSSCRHLIRALGEAPRDSTHPEDVDTRWSMDHSLDSARYFLHTHFKGPKGAPEPYTGESNASPYYNQRAKALRRGGGKGKVSRLCKR